MNIAQIGYGFVGKALSRSFSKKGHCTIVYDKYQEIGSPEDVLKTDFLFLCLPTPYVEGHGFDLSAITENLKFLSQNNYAGLVILKSTVEPGTTERLNKQFRNLQICHNPEFLTARTADEDFHNQTHIVLGYNEDWNDSREAVSNLASFFSNNYPNAKVSICTSRESESMKLFCNNFYAMKVQIFNEFYFLCQKMGVDYEAVKGLMLANDWINPMHTVVPGPDGQASYGGACVSPESILIERGRGKILAADVRAGDKIFDGSEFTSVTKVGSRHVSETIKIKSRGRSLRGSKDHIHMVYCKNSEKIKEKLLGDIENGDWLYIPSPKLNGLQSLSLGPKPKLKGLRASNWIENVEITPRVARMMGLYCAEGYSNVYSYNAKDRDKKKDYTVCWTFGPSEEFLADELVETLSHLGLTAKKKFKVSEKATFGISRTWSVRKRSYWLYSLVKALGLGSNAHDKNSPLLSGNLARAFISGWLDGDGTFDSSTNTVSGFSRSKSLIKSVDTMLLSLGIQGSVTRDGQQINVSMRSDVKEIISWSNHPKFNVEPEYKTNFIWSSTNSRPHESGWITKVSSVEKIMEEHEVISIETNSHLYVANNMLTHNCFPKDTNALKHLMKTLGSPHRVLQACIEERDSMREFKLK